MKQTREEGRLAEGRIRREGEEAQGRLKETIQQSEHSLLALQSEIDQLTLRNKELTNRVASLTTLLSKRTEEADRQAADLSKSLSENAQVR